MQLPPDQDDPRAEIEHAGTRMVFATPNTATKWRVETIREKEPVTLEWIATIGRDEILFDVGANVGMYTIWAAATQGARVFAFEPESQNYGVLNRNILLNNLHDRVTAFCVGLSDRQEFTDLHMAGMVAGGSCHAVGEPLDYKQEPLVVGFRQGCVALRLDDLLEGGLPIPQHIKIDVDGIEAKVIAGGKRMLDQAALKSLLIEVNPALADHREMARTLNAIGFQHDPAQVERAARKEGPFKGVAEYIFRRGT